MVLLRFLLMAIIVAGGFGFIIYQLAKFAFFIQSPKGLAKKDGSQLRQAIKSYIPDLIPLTDSEVELFSLNREEKRVRKTSYVLTTGVYKSIFHEPLMAFALKRYRGRKITTLLSRTHDHEYFYIDMKGEVQVYHNGYALGIINASGQLISPDRKQILAQIDPIDVLKLQPISVENREIGKLLNPVYADTVNPRAFHLMENMNEREKVLFMAVTFYKIARDEK